MVIGGFKRNNRKLGGGYLKYRSPSIYDRTPKKNNFEFKFSKGLIKLIVYALIFSGLLYFFFFSAKFQVKDIFVEGNNLLTRDEVLSAFHPNQNIFLFDAKRTKDALVGKFPEIESLEIYRGIPNALKIVLLEREGKIVWQSGEEKYLLSSQGEVARKIVGDEGKGMPIVIDKKGLPVSLGNTLVSSNFIAFILNLNSNFYKEVNINPINFEINETTFDVNLSTDAGFYIKFNSLRSSKKQIDSLKKVLVDKRQDIHEYIDLRIDGWAYYK